jgi:hypothetical protein
LDVIQFENYTTPVWFDTPTDEQSERGGKINGNGTKEKFHGQIKPYIFFKDTPYVRFDLQTRVIVCKNDLIL